MRSLSSRWTTIRQRIVSARLVLLCCDVDGTLARIADHPAHAQLPTGTKRLLRQLVGLPGFRVVFVSGRALADLKRIVGIQGAYYVGNHGLEMAGPSLAFTHPQARRARPRLRRLARQLSRALRDIPGALVEWKGLTVSAHWRSVPPSAHRLFHRRVEACVGSWRRRGWLRQRRGKRVIELLPPVAWDKGRAVTWLLRHLSPRGGAAGWWVIYLGDDRSDEDAFRVTNRLRGLTVFVGPRRVATAAAYWLKSPRDVQRWFSALQRAQSEAFASRREPWTGTN
ncbi:MAG: trehalose-phosphatase [Candidatus Omnitrophica bacterium]|nr:trehalose-phosphatase [Candidatus Omnitrophota bacterium]